MKNIEKSWYMFPTKPESFFFQAWRKEMEGRIDPSTLNYVLKMKKFVVANSEAIIHALNFESEMDAWLEKLDEPEKEVEDD